MELKDKVVVITGSGRGLGRGMVLAFAQKGANVAVVDLNEDDIAQTVALAEELGVKAKGYKVNVAKEEEVEKLFADVVADFGTLSGVINNAGITRDGLLIKAKDGVITKMSTQQWQTVIDVNLTGVFLCAREAAAKMIELGVDEGVIVNISSLARHGSFGQTNYSAAKAGVVAMTESWAKELARYNIRTGAIAPGTINTDMIAAMKPEARDRLVSAVPLKRLGEASNIAKAATFIFENDYFTGRVVEVDGGLR
ncbi:SDR family oxidoreductase [Ketobacter alkanivorans]|uniref:2,3-dihydroxy-2,3-dihydro-p-cumate dehydrogenase n=1 Tax=Ketobacter alkanivorans TaxID=1917421 RepID=A0A2K9LPR1_9GAMM|nr:SDR family oxidoreductase [Ketobacter alkanivorans]AUM14131.1 3-oxoacyl-ACP reductase [Ketobacter alkanivorans]